MQAWEPALSTSLVDDRVLKLKILSFWDQDVYHVRAKKVGKVWFMSQIIFMVEKECVCLL